LIVQHVRERFHPFNTARIVRRALQNSSLLVDQTKNLAGRLRLKPRAGLLYPGTSATLISDVPADQRPEQLVIIDGTWHHAKTLVRDIPALAALPRYRLAPAEESRYRIRREPNAMALSTIEATVAALGMLEPETVGLEQLLAAFESMVERQLAHPKSVYGRRIKQRASRTVGNIPRVVLDDLTNIVVAYGESAAGLSGSDRAQQSPVYWVAQRLGTSERFSCLIQSDRPMSETFLGHLELTHSHFAAAVSLDEARANWDNFVRPSDTIAVYNQGTARLLSYLSGGAVAPLLLKAVDFNPERRYSTLDELLAGEGLVPAAAQFAGRAGKRLANAVALVRHLAALGHAGMSDADSRAKSLEFSRVG
jgi:DTW domain-containing protein YfiP